MSSPVVALVLAAACAAPHTFACRVAYAPLVDKLRAAGGSPDDVVHPTSAHDLDRLERGHRYKFAVTADGKLAIAPRPADAPGNEYVHPILAGGAPVRTAGGLVVDGSGRVTVDQDSKSYCPTAASLAAAVQALHAIGVGDVATADKSPGC